MQLKERTSNGGISLPNVLAIVVVALFAVMVLPVSPAHASTPGATTTTLKSSLSYVQIGGSVTLTAKVTDTSSSPTTPTGTIAWSDGGAGGSFTINGKTTSTCTLKHVSLRVSSCKVTYVASSSAALGQTITIQSTYSGDASHSSSSAQLSLTVPSRTTSTVITPSTVIVGYGAGATFTATVVDTSPGVTSAPTGKVLWNATPKLGTFSSRSCILVPINSTASSCHVTYTPPLPGSESVIGTYQGDSQHGMSTGQALIIIVH